MKTDTIPKFCWVTDRSTLDAAAGQSREAALLERIHEAAQAGLDWIQLREKDLQTPQLVDLAHNAVAASQKTNTRILVNDRLDIAWAVGAAGVHLGEKSLPVAEVSRAAREAVRNEAARKKVGVDFLVGASCHSLEGTTRAASDGADYVFFGPVFATPSKLAFGEPQGLARLRMVCRATAIPVFAIGGITKENARACIDAGASGLAAIRLFQDEADLSALIKLLR